MLIPTAFIADKSKKKKVTPVSKEEQAKAFDILKQQTEKEKASEQGFIQDQLIAQDEAIQRQRAGLSTQKPKSYTEITVPTPAIPVAPTVKTTSEGLVKKTFNTKYGVVDYVATPEESKIFKGTDVNAINNLTKDIVQYFEGLGRDQGRKPIVKNTREKYTFDEVNAGLNPNFVEEETRKRVKQFEDATLGKLDVLGVRTRLNELADYAKQSDSTLGQVAGGLIEGVANPMTTFAMSTGNIVDPNATLEERGGAALNLGLAAIPIGQFAGAATAGASAFKQGLSSGLRNAIKVGAREYAKNTLFGNLALSEINLDSVVRQLRDAGEVEGNVLRFKNDLRIEAKRSGVNPSDYLKNKFQEAEVTVEPSIPSPTQATLGQLVDETIPNQPGGAELNLLRTAETGKPTYTVKAGAKVVSETGNPAIDEALKTANEITSQVPTTGNSAIDEAFKVEQEIAGQVTRPSTIQGISGVSEELPVSSVMQAEQPPIPPTQTATTAIPEASNPPIEVGISNKANLSAQELKLISQAPQGQGRSASKVVEDVIQHNPADEELNILAGKVANGEALNAEQTAMLLVGQGRFNLKVFNAREALDNAIKLGASTKDIDKLQEAWLIAQEEATNFAKQIQRGKSGWSDVGRVLQQKTDLFTGELSQIKANIIAEAELRKGRKLTDAEQENYKTMIDKLIGENKKLEEELAKLKATRNETTQEGRVRRTQTSTNLDKLIAKKENTIRVNKATVTQKLNSEIPVATATRVGQWITNMKLLNPFSRLADVESNAIKLLDNIATTPLNMAIDQATSRALKAEPVYSSSYLTSDRAKNLVENAWEKMKADANIVMAGGDVETIEKFGGNAGLGSKAAGLTDVPFKAVYHEDGKFIAADVKARELLKEELGAGNFGKKDIEARRTEILNNIEEHPDVIMNAEEYALNETFNNQNWASKINKAAKGILFKSPTAQLTYDELIGRFSKVITNVAIDVADRTGLGVARGVYNIADAIKSGKNLTVAERMAINKMITKGMVGMPLMYLGIKNWDKIEGEIRGVQQKYIDYGDLGKLGGPIAIFLHGASIGRAMNELPEDKVNDFVIASSLKLPLNTPFVSNVAEISDVLDNPAPKAIAKLLAKKASNTLIPAIVREIAMRMDTEKGFQTGMEPEREKYPKGSGAFDIVKGELQSKIPGLRQQLPLKNQKVGRPNE
jgi:ubiquitin